MTLLSIEPWLYGLQARVLLEKHAFYIHASVRLTSKERTLTAPLWVNARASPSDRVVGMIRNSNTRESDSILY